jgi:hypothetical protein
MQGMPCIICGSSGLHLALVPSTQRLAFWRTQQLWQHVAVLSSQMCTLSVNESTCTTNDDAITLVQRRWRCNLVRHDCVGDGAPVSRCPIPRIAVFPLVVGAAGKQFGVIVGRRVSLAAGLISNPHAVACINCQALDVMSCIAPDGDPGRRS